MGKIHKKAQKGILLFLISIVLIMCSFMFSSSTAYAKKVVETDAAGSSATGQSSTTEITAREGRQNAGSISLSYQVKAEPVKKTVLIKEKTPVENKRIRRPDLRAASHKSNQHSPIIQTGDSFDPLTLTSLFLFLVSFVAALAARKKAK